jgi:uncharacterized protein (DUF1501 family)
MSDYSRRAFLRSVAAAGLVGCTPARIRSGASTRPQSNTSGPRPHYVIEVALMGGFDSVLTIDPKEQGLVGDTIDCGYAADARIKGPSRIWGPLAGDLVKHDQDLALVHGVRVDTVSHVEAMLASLTGKIAWKGGSSVASAIAPRLPGHAAIPYLMILSGEGAKVPFRDGASGGNFFDLPFDPMGIAVGVNAWGVLRRAASLQRGAVPWHALTDDAADGVEDPKVVEAIRATANRQQALCDLYSRATPRSRFTASDVGPGLSVALDAIANNLAGYVRVAGKFLWYDSHTDNYRLQSQRTVAAFADISAFLDQLKVMRNAFGPLIDQTTVLVYSELGRFPKLNHSLGKDHFPESSWIMFGRGIRRGSTVGATSNKLQGLPINYGSGQLDPRGRTITLDAMFATVCKIAGVDPSLHGYKSDDVIGALTA